MLLVLTLSSMAATALPGTSTAFRQYQLASATREVATQVRAARLLAVTANATMRVRFNCPSPGQMRIVQVVGTPAIDDAEDRCSAAVYPYPDQNVAVQPNHDGPVMMLRGGIRLAGSPPDIDIAPTGRITALTGGLPLIIVVSDTHEARSLTITAAGQVRSS